MQPARASRAEGAVQFFALEEQLVPLPVPPGVTSAHELFDGLPLGVYSALRTFEHVRFLGLEHHFERMDRSMELLGWSERLERARWARALDAAAHGYPGSDAFVRFDVLAGPAPGSRARHLLALSPFHAVPEAFLRTGVGVGVSPLRRAQPLIKKASFVIERRPYPLARQEAYEHLIVDEERRILEGTSSNFLAVRAGRLHLAGDEALQGVTQRIVSALARTLGLEPVRAPVRLDELATLDEAFLTGSTRGLVPVVQVEGRPIGAGRVGPWTQRLLEAYRSHAREHARRATEVVAARR